MNIINIQSPRLVETLRHYRADLVHCVRPDGQRVAPSPPDFDNERKV